MELLAERPRVHGPSVGRSSWSLLRQSGGPLASSVRPTEQMFVPSPRASARRAEAGQSRARGGLRSGHVSDERRQRRPRRICKLLPCVGALARASRWGGTRPPRASNKDLGSRSLESLTGSGNAPGAGKTVPGLTPAIFVRAQRECISPAALGSQNSAGGWAGGAAARVAAVAAVGELLLAGRRARRTRAERARNLHFEGGRESQCGRGKRYLAGPKRASVLWSVPTLTRRRPASGPPPAHRCPRCGHSRRWISL